MIVLKNANIVDVYSGEIIKGNVGFENKEIVFVDLENDIEKLCKKINNSDIKIFDLKGKYLSPTFIDGHIHIESSHVIPSEFEKFALKSGVSRVVIDPHEIANVAGKEGILFMLNNAKILDVYVMIPSCVPATKLETSGGEITAKDIEELIILDNVLGLGEVMDYMAVINGDEEILKKIEVAKRYKKLIDGHCPKLRGRELNQYIKAGIMSDHESVEEEEALEKLRLGLKLMVREGTASKNIYLLKIRKKISDIRNIMLVSDDLCIKEADGYMFNILRKATNYISPIEAIQMVTVNPGNYFGLDVGIKPGNEASFVIFEDLNNFKVCDIIIKGKFLEEILNDLNKIKKRNIPKNLLNTMNYQYKKEMEFLIKGIDYRERDGLVRVIKPIKDSLITEELIFSVEEVKLLLKENVINKIFVIERHKNTGNIGKGLIYNFLNCGALASSYAHDSHNVIAIGNDEKDLSIAVNKLKDIGGGFIAVKDGEVVDYLPLPIGGLMGDDGNYVLNKMKILSEKIHEWSVFENPFLSMSFFSLPVIPELKITDIGLIKNMEKVDLFL
ncbi:adenine deaminase [Methanocaldococcus vulcanius M7]|uniref:Adenine deaminase n=1 Tax=Methanocaldococcus vulcanius (strain ATCC 700851 / DSM 12094 / M7) TaxID=579137 RepID=C9RH79_METVM|nr:adenine deaminase [Methanocaldococcus vulcanius]ACX72931.1 adenine deaminase [Methanocaldococcus vulcanius M7]